MSKIKNSSRKVPSPFDQSTHKTERTAAPILMHWMRVIIEKENLDLGLPDVETSASDRKMPDLVIYESRRSKQVLCLIEAKLPYFDPFSESDLKEPARKKATQRRAKYFGTTNFKKLIWYNTAKVNELKPEEEQIIEKYELSGIENVNEIENFKYSEPTKKALKVFLKKLLAVSTGKEAEPKQALDDLLIFRIQEKIRILSTYYTSIIEDKAHKDSKFLKELRTWFAEQGWNFTLSDDDYKKAARQTAYLLINKILFYDLLQIKRPDQLDPLEINEGLTKGSLLQSHLQGYFNDVLKIDYETIYTTDFIDVVAFPNHKEIVKEIKEFVKILKRYDFTNLGFDIIGRIFERIIPEEERHILGQYFTNADVIDLILRFCLKHEDDKVLDPSCGAGTFLVRAYQHKKLMNQLKDHVDILDSLWGNDIAKFPAHLATINLAINDLTQDQNYPNILQEDFFALHVGKNGFEAESWRKRRAKTLGKEVKEITYPRWFDVIIGNPPYTRQEEIPDIGVDKEKLIESALTIGDKKIADISKRAGLPAYFFVHGTKFLKNEGYFGFIVSNSWLDTNYGKGLQEFFLKNYKIVAIIESMVERWFEDADINTSILILQKCTDEKLRNNNVVRFVYLKKRIDELIPPIQKLWERQIERIDAIDSLIKTILGHSSLYENDDLRIFTLTQEILRREGEIDAEYQGGKWGKYLRAPNIFFQILLTARDKLDYLKNVAKVETYLNTGGADGFYFLKEVKKSKDETTVLNPSKEGGKKEFVIENKFLRRFIKSPRELNKIEIEEKNAKWLIVIPPLKPSEIKGTKLKKYIAWGESKSFHLRSGPFAREPWFKLPEQATEPGEILFSRIHDDSHIVYYNPLRISNTNFYSIIPYRIPTEILVVLLNSTFYAFIKEIDGRVNFGQGALKTEGSDIKNFLIVKEDLLLRHKKELLECFKEIKNIKIGNIFDELGCNDRDSFSIDNVNPIRLKLDRIIFQKILNLSEVQLIEFYKALVAMVKSRIDKSKSFGRNKGKSGVDLYKMKNSLVHIIKESTS